MSFFANEFVIDALYPQFAIRHSSTTGYNDWGRRPTIKRNLRRVMNLGDGRKIMMKKDDSFGLNFFLSITTMLIKKCVFESSDEKWMNCSYQMYFIYQYGSFKVMNCQETKLILGRIYLEEYGGKVDLATLIKWERICFLANKSIFLCSPTAQEHFYPHLLHIVMDLPITTPSQLVDTALLLLGVFFNARNQSIINDSCILLCKIGANPRILLNSFIARFRQRHADMLLRTGPTEANMTEYIRIFTFFNCMIMMLKSMQLRIYDFDGKELAVIIDSLDKLLHRQLFLQEHTIQSIFEPIQFTQGSGSFEHGNKQNEQSEQSSLLQLVSVTLGVPAQFPNQLGKDIQNSNLQSAKFVVNPAQSCAFRLISFCIFTSLAPSTERCGIQKIILNGIPHNNQENIKILRNKDKILQQELADELFLSCFDRLVDPLTSLLTRMCKCRFQDRYQDSPSELDLIQHNSIPELQVHNHLVGTLALSLLWDIFQMTGGEVAPQQQQIPQNVQVASEEIKKQMELSNVEIDNNINQTITKNYSILKDIPSILLLQQRSPLERIKLTKLGRWGGGIYSPYAIPIINEEIWNNKQQVHLGLNLKDQKNQLDIFSDLPHISITIKRRIREIDLNWLKDTISCAYPDRRSLGIRGLCRALILASVHTPLPEIRQVSSPIPHHFSLEEPEAVLNCLLDLLFMNSFIDEKAIYQIGAAIMYNKHEMIKNKIESKKLDENKKKIEEYLQQIKDENEQYLNITQPSRYKRRIIQKHQEQKDKIDDEIQDDENNINILTQDKKEVNTSSQKKSKKFNEFIPKELLNLIRNLEFSASNVLNDFFNHINKTNNSLNSISSLNTPYRTVINEQNKTPIQSQQVQSEPQLPTSLMQGEISTLILFAAKLSLISSRISLLLANTAVLIAVDHIDRFGTILPSEPQYSTHNGLNERNIINFDCLQNTTESGIENELNQVNQVNDNIPSWSQIMPHSYGDSNDRQIDQLKNNQSLISPIKAPLTPMQRKFVAHENQQKKKKGGKFSRLNGSSEGIKQKQDEIENIYNETESFSKKMLNQSSINNKQQTTDQMIFAFTLPQIKENQNIQTQSSEVLNFVLPKSTQVASQNITQSTFDKNNSSTSHHQIQTHTSQQALLQQKERNQAQMNHPSSSQSSAIMSQQHTLPSPKFITRRKLRFIVGLLPQSLYPVVLECLIANCGYNASITNSFAKKLIGIE